MPPYRPKSPILFEPKKQNKTKGEGRGQGAKEGRVSPKLSGSKKPLHFKKFI